MTHNLTESLTCKDLAPEGLHERADEVVQKMLTMPQGDAPIIHRFAPGLYIREVHLRAGSFVIGHEHKTSHFNVMLSGHLVMVNEDGTLSNFIAPQSYVAPPGRKIVYIVEDTVWQNIYASDETDIDKLEDQFLIKTERYLLSEEMQLAAARAEHEVDRFDYKSMLDKFGMTEEFARSTAEHEGDQTPFSGPVHPYRLARSPIEGVGYFLTVGAKAGAILAPALINGKRTPAGRYVNHSLKPNAEMRYAENGNMYLVAIKDIAGCVGGGIGTEVTTDYGNTIQIMANRPDGDKLCQQ